MSQDAATLVRTLVHDADLPAGAGVRIVIDPTHNSLSMDVARRPELRDTVVSHDGAQLFLTQAAAGRLQERTLQAEISASRSLFFLDTR
jgi:hypothetical protein